MRRPSDDRRRWETASAPVLSTTGMRPIVPYQAHQDDLVFFLLDTVPKLDQAVSMLPMRRRNPRGAAI